MNPVAIGSIEHSGNPHRELTLDEQRSCQEAADAVDQFAFSLRTATTEGDLIKAVDLLDSLLPDD